MASMAVSEGSAIIGIFGACCTLKGVGDLALPSDGIPDT
jgi:hypothetical protein